MRITIFTFGTRGDTQPYVALGAGLRRAGHQVRVSAPEVFRDLITEAGLELVPVRSLSTLSPQEMMGQPEIQGLKFTNPLTLVRLYRLVRSSMAQVVEEFWLNSADADLLIASTIALSIFDCAEKRGVPCVYAPLHAMTPTRAFPSTFLSPWGVRFNSPLNRLTHQAMQLASWEMFRADINQWRRQQSLIPHPHFGYYRWQQRHTPLTLCGFSPSILPRPSDWPSSHHVTGYWFLDEPPSWQPPADLVRFLESGPPPIYLGFGSMSIENPERLTQVCLEALRISGQRGVLSAGWSGLHHQTPSDDMYPVGSIPHSWLFPRVAVCVHHGGMGTTAAALRAGVPQIIAPVVSDQPYWAERMAQLGVGERCANPTQLTSEVLATAITRAVTDPERRQRAVDLGAQVSAEDGVGQAVQLINQVLL